MTTSTIVLCSICGTPARVVFDENGKIKVAYFVCKCPRPAVEKINAQFNGE